MEENIFEIYCRIWGGCQVYIINGNVKQFIQYCANLPMAKKFTAGLNNNMTHTIPVKITEEDIYEYGKAPKPDSGNQSVLFNEIADNITQIAVNGTVHNRNDYTRESWLQFAKTPMSAC